MYSFQGFRSIISMEPSGGVQDLKITPVNQNGEGFEPLVVVEFCSTANRAAIEWLLAKLQAPKAEGGADLMVKTIYLQHNQVQFHFF